MFSNGTVNAASWLRVEMIKYLPQEQINDLLLRSKGMRSRIEWLVSQPELTAFPVLAKGYRQRRDAEIKVALARRHADLIKWQSQLLVEHDPFRVQDLCAAIQRCLSYIERYSK